VEDDRCGGCDSNDVYVDEAGDLYVACTNGGGFMELFGQDPPHPPHACALRIRAGTTEFDPDFHLDLVAATGTQAINKVYWAGGHTLLVQGLPQGVEATTANYAQQTFASYLVDLDTGMARRAEGFPDSQTRLNRSYRYDDATIAQTYTSVTGTNAVEVYRVFPDRPAELLFPAIGDLYGVGVMSIR
jgi:hypothetical protein